jgi:transcriptional regulator with XRE-family HTH domain
MPIDTGAVKIRDVIRDAIRKRMAEDEAFNVAAMAERLGMSRGRIYEYLSGRDIGVSRALAMLAAAGLEVLIVDLGELPSKVSGARRAKKPAKPVKRRMVGPLPGAGGYRA